MLSKRYDIGEFIEKIKDYSYDEVILLSNQEATDTERRIIMDCGDTGCQEARQYVSSLKAFILFMRHGVIARSIRNCNLKYFRIDIR